MRKLAINGGKPTRDVFLPFSKPTIGKEEIRSVTGVLKSGWLTMGAKVKEFEDNFKNYVGSEYAIAVQSCTFALHLSLVCIGVESGDEVITTPFTFAATANVIVWERAKPVFVDIDPESYNITPDMIEEKITEKTKAIIPVHFAGQPCDMDPILRIARKHDLRLIEDAAHATGSTYNGRKIGTIGDVTCFSFYPTKNITTGEGGIMTTNDAKVAEKTEMLRLHGMDKSAWKRYSRKGSWYYQIKYAGYKYNMTDIQAALGIEQLKKLDKFNQKRIELARYYSQKFENISEIATPKDKGLGKHVYHLYPIQVRTDNLKIDRDRFIQALKAENIGTSVHFIPLHLHPFYQKSFGYRSGDFPVAEETYRNIVSLPLFPKMNKEDVDDVVVAIEKILRASRK